MCNFASMKQNLPNIIRENKELQQTLLKQEGGIIKYLAEHIDADGIVALYEDYRTQCLNAFRDEHKWDMGEDEMVRGALDDNHIRKELAYQVALRPVFLRFPDVMDAAISFITKYLNFAFKKCHPELYPNVIPDMKFYEEVIIQYGDRVFGKAHRCLWLVLNEHRGKAKAEKDEAELWTEFELQKYAQIYVAGLEKLRRAVKELIYEKTRGKGEEECRQICRKEAKDVMKRLWSFTRLVNGDDDILELHLKENPRLYETWSSKDLELGGASVSFIEKQKKYISKEEKVWLREGMMVSPLQKCFQCYYQVLEEIGDIWAVQLREYDIDIRELEKETGCILNKRGIYVERSLGGLLGKVIMPSYPTNEQNQVDGQQSINIEQDTTQSHDKQHGEHYYGKDIAIFHENLDPRKIANKILLLDRKKAGGKKIGDRNFILILYNVFSNHPGCMTTRKKIDLMNWVKFNCKIYFKTDHLRNVTLDDEEMKKIDLYHAEFANKQPNGKWYFKKEFYQIDPKTKAPKKSIDGAW